MLLINQYCFYFSISLIIDMMISLVIDKLQIIFKQLIISFENIFYKIN